MTHHHLHRALLISASLLMGAGAAAQSPNAAPPAKANAALHAGDKDKDKDKDEDKTNKGQDKDNTPNAMGTKAGDSDHSADRQERAKAEHDAERNKLVAALHGPMDDSMKAELQKHALRVAYLVRIQQLATELKDKDIADRASKLLDKERARHDKWFISMTATAQTTPAPETKGGAQ